MALSTLLPKVPPRRAHRGLGQFVLLTVGQAQGRQNGMHTLSPACTSHQNIPDQGPLNLTPSP